MAENDANKKDVEIKHAVCWPSPGCHDRCGVLVHVENGKVVKITGNPEFPTGRAARGWVCSDKSPHLSKWLYHPDQLMYPLKRTGERGENQWERISWDQALDEIAEKLKRIMTEYGAESLAFVEGTYRSDLYEIRARFQNLIGNPGNVAGPGTICSCNTRALRIAVAGTPIFSSKTNIAKCIVFPGKNMSESRPMHWRSIKRWMQKEPKPKLIVIDPRQIEVAREADIWMQIRPGTDTALFLAWLNVIIEENLYDKDFVEKWTFGFEQLKKRVSEYTPERVSEITWIPAKTIRESARMYATNKPACFVWGVASDQIGLNGIRAEQTKMCLRAITGNMKVDGPETALGPGPLINGKMGIRDSMLQLEEKCSPEQRKKQLGYDRFKLMAWPCYEIIDKLWKETYGIPLMMADRNFACPENLIWRAILEEKPYPVKAMIAWNANPMLHAANTKLVYKALKSPNLHLHVVLEHLMTPSAMLADYVLPAASKLEKAMLGTMEDFSADFVCGERPVEPLGERRSDYHFFQGIATRLGFGKYFPWETEEELNDYRLEPLGITFKEAATKLHVVSSDKPWTYETINPKTGKPTGFTTPTGKVELRSTVLEQLGYDPLPYYEEPPESPIRTPDVAKEYPLILITGGRFRPQFHSEQRQLGMGMREQHPDPLMEIHPDTAGSLGIMEGDWAHIETPRGVIKQKAKLTTGIHPKVVNIESSWWFPEQPAQEPWLHGVWESNANVLTQDDPDTCDPLSGGWPMRALLCKVYKVQKP